MKLNKRQRIALTLWLGSKLPDRIFDSHAIVDDLDEFCDGEIREWRIIHTFGIAGKIWNVDNHIYITGYSPCETSKSKYNKQQIIIDEWNEEIKRLIEKFSWDLI